jgi:hypothetical protein
MTNFFWHKNAFFSTLISPIDPASQPYHATRLSACFRTASFSLGWVGPEKMTLISFSDLPPPGSVLVPHRQCKECTRCQVCYFSFCEPIHLLHKNLACWYWRLELEQRKKHTRNRGFLVSFGASQSDYERLFSILPTCGGILQPGENRLRQPVGKSCIRGMRICQADGDVALHDSAVVE